MRHTFWALASAAGLAMAAPADADADADTDSKRCERGLAAHGDNDPVLAHILLADCDSPAANKARGVAGKALAAGDYAPLSIVVEPEGARIELQPTGVSFSSPRQVWLPFGTYRITATSPGFESFTTEIELTDRDRYTLPLRLSKRGSNPREPRTVTFDDVDSGGPAAGVVTAKDPTPAKHKSLLPDRYQRAPSPAPSPEDRDGGPGLVPWLTLGTGVILGIGGATATVFAVERDADRAVFASVAVFAAGAVLTGAGLYLVLSRVGPRVAVAPPARGRGAMILYRWQPE